MASNTNKLPKAVDIATNLQSFLLDQCIGRPNAIKGRSLARRFSTNVDQIKEAFRLLRHRGIMVGICWHGYYVIDNIDEYRVSLYSYFRRYRSAEESFASLLESGRRTFGDSMIDDILTKLHKGKSYVYDEKNESAK